MEIITSFKLEDVEIKDVVYALNIALNERNKHLLSEEQIERMDRMLHSLLSYSGDLDDYLESKKKI